MIKIETDTHIHIFEPIVLNRKEWYYKSRFKESGKMDEYKEFDNKQEALNYLEQLKIN